MPENINSAYRVYKIFSKLPKQAAGNVSIADAWRVCFGVDAKTVIQRNLAVAQMLNFLQAEIIETRQKMEGTSVPPSIYSPAINQALSTLNISQLETMWGPIPSEATIQAFLWCSQSISNEEDLVDQAELDSLIRDLEGFTDSIDKSDLTLAIKQFFRSQINIMHGAILQYPVRGEKAFTYAVSEAAVSVAINPEIATEGKETSYFKELVELWERVRNVTSHVDTAVKLLTWGKMAHDTVALLVGSGS